MALSLKGRVIYKGGNGPWKVEAEDQSTTDVRAELDKIDAGKTRAERRLRRRQVKVMLTNLSGELVHVELSDEGEVQVNKQEPVMA